MSRLLLLAAAAVTLAGAGCRCTEKCFGGWGRDCEAGTTLPPATVNAGGPGGVVQTGANKPATNPDAGMTQAGFNIQGATDECATGK